MRVADGARSWLYHPLPARLGTGMTSTLTARSSVVRMPPADTLDDPWRLREALDGDVAAWTAIVDEFTSTMWHWARSAGLSREDAEDVVQSVWYRLADRGHAIDEPARLAGWLATTTKRAAWDVLRRRGRRPESPGPTDVAEWQLPDVSAGPAAQVEADDLSGRLVEAFGTLREKCRDLLSLLWEPDVSYDDISATLDMPIGSIGPTRARCLDQLRRAAGVA